MTIQTIVEGSAEKEYRTSDDILVRGLLMLNHRPVRIEVENSSVIYYIFDLDIIQDDMNKLLTNENVNVQIRDVWSSNHVWTMNLRKARSM